MPLVPYGVPVYAAASGVATTDTTAWVESPKNMTIERPTLSILVGPTMDQSLLDVLFAAPPACQFDVGRIASDMETATSDLMAAIGLQKMLGPRCRRRRRARKPKRLDARIRSAISLLLSSQSGDGGWGWTGSGGASERYATSRVLWALSLARKAGYNVPDDQFQKAVGSGAKANRRRGRQRLREQGDSVARAVDKRTKATSPWPTACTASGCNSRPGRWPIWRWP